MKNSISPHYFRKRNIILSILLLVSVIFSIYFLTGGFLRLNSIAKGANLEWEYTYGKEGDERAFSAVATTDGFLIVGSSTSNPLAKTEAWALKVSKNGKELWNQTFTEKTGAEFRSVICLEDGFLLSGNVFLASGGTNGYVVKIDSQGKLLWKVTLNATEGFNKLFSAVKFTDGFVLVGLSRPYKAETSDVWLLKIDFQGQIMWNRTFGGTGEQAGRSAAILEGGDILVAGYSDVLGDGNFDFLVVRTDSQGNVIWSKCYGGKESDKCYSIDSNPKEVVISGDTRSKGAGDCDAWILKIDLDGNVIWDSTSGGKGFDTPTHITSEENGGYIVSGTSFSFGNGKRDFWAFKLDDFGKEEWNCTVGRENYEEAYVLISEKNNSILLVGWTNSIGNGKYDFYIVNLQIPQ